MREQVYSNLVRLARTEWLLEQAILEYPGIVANRSILDSRELVRKDAVRMLSYDGEFSNEEADDIFNKYIEENIS